MSTEGLSIVVLAGLLTAAATGLGAVPFAFTRSVTPRTVSWADALASGLMLGASFGLVVEGSAHGSASTIGGAAMGVLFVLLADRWLAGRQGARSLDGGGGARRMVLMVSVMTIHSFAEGIAVGVAFAGGAALAGAITLAIALHNIPEGLAISAVLRPRGTSVLACAAWSVFTSLPQPLMAVPAYLLVESFRPVLPWGLGFAAGAMVFMVLSDLLPEAYEAVHSRAVALLVSVTLIGMVLLQRHL